MEDDGGPSSYIPEGTMPRSPHSGDKTSSCIAQVTSHHRSFPPHVHCPFPRRKSGGRKSGSELDVKYTAQSMEYEVSTMRSAGKSGERTKELAESLHALIRHNQGSGRSRHRCVSGKSAAYVDMVDYHDCCLRNSTSCRSERCWQVTQFIALSPAEHVTRDRLILRCSLLCYPIALPLRKCSALRGTTGDSGGRRAGSAEQRAKGAKSGEHGR